jgi:hypothetical protein
MEDICERMYEVLYKSYAAGEMNVRTGPSPLINEKALPCIANRASEFLKEPSLLVTQMCG